MADIEVENILREIRERVYAEQEAANADCLTDVDGGGSSRENSQLESADLARLESYLTTTARAWDRLPPLVSNRRGATARLELWLKRHFKRATRWYAWEQINFNAAVHHALGDIVQLLAANEKTIENLRAESASRQADLEQTLRLEFNSRRAIIEAIDAEDGAIKRAIEDRVVVVDDRIAAIVNELREVTTRLQEEQRVSYKQLALETSEAAVLEDRARRKTEAMLEDFARRVEELEARK
ncbi:MAG TPA: hypothetical protein VMZ30_22675 [Pyrinomonadaceae bacterium]|nr:hypothetical protein [Pyrinomonadaceae bacterium]